MDHTTETRNGDFASALLRNIRFILILGGINQSKKYDKKTKRYVTMLWIVTATAMSLLQFVFLCKTTFDRSCEGKSIQYILLFVGMNSTTLILTVSISCKIPTKLENLEKKITRIGNTHGLSCNVSKWRIRMKIALVAYVVYSVYVTFAFINGYLVSDLTGVLPLITQDDPYVKYIAYAFYSVTTFLIIVPNQGMILISIFLSTFLSKEIDGVNRKFRRAAESDDALEDSRIEGLIDHHEELIDVLNVASDCVCYHSFYGLFVLIPGNCLFTYFASLPATSAVYEFFIIFLLLATTCSTFGVKRILEASVSRKAYGTLNHIWTIKRHRLSEYMSQQLDMFVSSLTGDTIGYDVFGLLTINMPTLLGVFGTIATYIIVVIQFRQHPTSGGNLPANITLCMM